MEQRDRPCSVRLTTLMLFSSDRQRDEATLNV